MEEIEKGDWVYGLHHGKPIVGILDFYDHRFPCPYVLEGEGSCFSVRSATEEEILEEKKRRGETEVESELKVGDKVVVSRKTSIVDGYSGVVVGITSSSRPYVVELENWERVDYGRSDLKRVSEIKPILNHNRISDEVVLPGGNEYCPTSGGLWNWDKISKSVGYNTEPWDTEYLYDMLGLALKDSLFRSTPRTEVLTKTKTKKKLNLKFRTK